MAAEFYTVLKYSARNSNLLKHFVFRAF